MQDVPLTDDDFLKILNEIGDSEGLIVKVVDIFDFNGSWLPGLHRFVGSNPILLVGNKVDLLPKSVKHSKLIHWMKHEAKSTRAEAYRCQIGECFKRPGNRRNDRSH